jgi:SAM-dependent methyltransferase
MSKLREAVHGEANGVGGQQAWADSCPAQPRSKGAPLHRRRQTAFAAVEGALQLGGAMVRLPLTAIFSAIARNLSKRVGVTALVHRVRGGQDRGGESWSDRSVNAHADHVVEVFDGMHAAIGDVSGKTGAELGPGDDVGVAYCFLKAGAKKVYTIERFSSVAFGDRAVALFRAIDHRLTEHGSARIHDVFIQHDGRLALNPAKIEHKIGLFEECGLPEPVDFIYANDVMEHVDDPAVVFRSAFDALKPGGIFVNNIDLAGHNVFSNADCPLDFLTCPDWLWELMFSHLVTTNRVRYSQFLRCARQAGLAIAREEVLIRADAQYLRNIRPALIERYRDLPDEDLSVIQSRLTAVRPAAG